MKKLITILMLNLGLAGMLMAEHENEGGDHRAPEIDAGSAVSAIALLSGSLLVTRGRRKR
jgi:hypothetical protein